MSEQSAQLTAGSVMTQEIMVAREDWSLSKLVDFFCENQISGAPVLDAKENVVGMVSLRDIAEEGAIRKSDLSAGNGPGQTDGNMDTGDLGQMHLENWEGTVKEAMTPTVYTVPIDTKVSEIAKTMIAGRVHRLLVTKGTQIVGIVTSLDLLKLLTGEEDDEVLQNASAQAGRGE